MAIQYVGSKTAAFAGTTATNTTVSLTSGLTGGIDTAVRPGDFVIVAYGAGSTADRTLSIKDASGANYTLMGSELYANGTTYDANLRVAYKMMGVFATPDASVVLGPTGATADGGSYAIHVYRGVDPISPMDATPTTATGTATSRPNPPSITPVTAGALVAFAAMGACSTGTTAFAFASTTNLVQTNRASTNDSRTAMATRQTGWTSGAVDPAASTTGAANATDSWASVTYALRPAPEVAVTTGAPKIESSSFTASDGSANTIAARLPPGVTNGDLLVAYVLEYNPSPAATPPNPLGWNKADDFIATGDGSGAWMWKVASSEGATQSFATIGGVNRSQYVVILRISGADTTAPFDVTNSEATGTGTSRSNPGFTTAAAKELVLLLHDGGYLTAFPSGWGYAASGDGSGGLLYKYQDTAGAIGSVSMTQPSGPWLTHMAAIKPVPPMEAAATNVATAGATLTVTSAGGGGGNCGAPNVVGRTWAESATCAKPAGTTNGDYLVATCNIPWSSATSSAPTGWSEIGVSKTTDTSNHEVRMFARWVGSSPGSDGSDYTFPNSAYTVITNYRGVHTTDPIAAVVAYKFDNWSGTETFEHPGITVDAACAIIFGINGSRSASFQPPRFGRSLVYGDYGEQAGIHCSVIEAAGSVDAISLYQSGNSGIYASLMVALRGAPGTITAPYPLNVFGFEAVGPATLTRPAWLKENDVIVFFDTKSNTNLGSFSPSDFTQIGANGEPTVYYRKVGPIGSEPSSYVATASASNNFYGAWVVVGGVDPTSPLSATLVRNDGSSVTTRSHPGVSVTVDNSTVLAFFEGNGGWPKTGDEAGRYIYGSGPLYAFTRNTGATGTLISQTFDGPSFKALAFAFAPIPAVSGGVAQELTGSLAVVSTTLANLFKTSTQSASASGVVSTTAGLSKSVLLTGAATGLTTASAALGLAKPLSASVQGVASASSIPSLQKPLTATAAGQATTAADLTTGALQSLAGAIAAVSASSADLTKTASLAAGVAAITNVGVADMSLGKPLTGSGAAVSTTTALLSNIYALAGAGSVVATANPALSKTSAQVGSAGAQAAASADLSKGATLAGAAIGNATAGMDLTKSVAFAAGLAALSTTTGALTRVATLAGSSAGQSYAEADITVVGDYAATLISNTTATGNLTLIKPLAGALMPVQANAYANLEIRIPLVGSVAALSTVSASPGVAWAASAQAMVSTTTSGDVAITKTLAATVGTAASASAEMQVLKRLAGSGAAETSTTANVGVVKALAGSAQSVATITGDARTSQDQGEAYAQCSAGGSLYVEKPLAGAAVSTVPPINAFMFVTKTLVVNLTTEAQATLDLSVEKPLSGACVVSTETTGDITKTNTLAASVGAECYSLGNIMVRKIMGGGGIGYVTASAMPKYFLALASGIVVRSVAELFVPDTKIPGDVDAVIDVFVIHASVMSEDPEVSIDQTLIDVEVTG